MIACPSPPAFAGAEAIKPIPSSAAEFVCMDPVILAVDAGNTRLKWGLWRPDGWWRKGWLPSGEASRLAGVVAPAHPACAVVCCVAGEAVRSALAAGLERLGLDVLWVQAQADRYGVHNGYDEPAQLGADRYAMLVAAAQLALAPCVIVGAGTAVTVDALAGDGTFLGGLILPGPQLMRQALAGGTAGVKTLTGRVQDFPRSTGDAVETGIWRALSGAVEDMRERLARTLGQPVEVVLTGGEATVLAPHVAGPRRVVEDLVLEGLACIARLE